MNSNPQNSIESEIEEALGDLNLQEIDGAESSSQPARRRSENLQRGTVVGISGKDVFIELGPRMQGVISLDEFEVAPATGDSFDFTLRGREEDLWLLSRKEAMELAAWDDLEVGSLVKARVTGVNTGGLELKIGPMAAFMPASQVALERVEDFSSYINQTLTSEVLEIARERKRVVISRRAVLEREVADARTEALDSLDSGSVVRGKVTRIEKFGAFVEIRKGVEGLVHVSNISLKRVEDPNDVLKVGEDVEALVLEIKEGGKRIGLSMKALEPDPWREAPYRYRENTIVEGTVVRLMEFGAFVELEPGIDGLIHVSQFSRDRVARVRDAVKVGESLAVRVVSVDVSAQRIALSRLDEHGAVIGSEDAADAGAVQDVLDGMQNQSLGTNLGSLFRKAMEED
jgi:small subunit ribosomal protein S1